MRLTPIILGLVVSIVAFFFCGCDKDEKKLLEHYKSQERERDPELIGWWKELYSEENHIYYTVYCENGEIHYYSQIDKEEIWKRPSVDYWYTEDENLYVYDYQKHWTVGSSEYIYNYIIEQDTLSTAEPCLSPTAIRVDAQK